jgi:hypothetical protein
MKTFKNEQMKRYIVSVPRKWQTRQVAVAYSVLAKNPKHAIRVVIDLHPIIKKDCNGEISVVEVSVGRYDSYNYFNKLQDFFKIEETK